MLAGDELGDIELAELRAPPLPDGIGAEADVRGVPERGRAADLGDPLAGCG